MTTPSRRNGLLVVMRHGSSEYNLQGRYQGSLDVKLSSEGRQQVLGSLSRIQDLGIQLVVSSPLVRARECARIISSSLQCPLMIIPEFSERDMGVFEGLSRLEVAQRYPSLLSVHESGCMKWSPPGGESLLQVAERLGTGLRRLNVRRQVPTLLVTHGTVCKLLYWLFGTSSFQDLRCYSVPNGHLAVYNRCGMPSWNAASHRGAR